MGVMQEEQDERKEEEGEEADCVLPGEEEEAGEQHQAVLLPPDPQTHPTPQQQDHQSSLVRVQGPTTPLDLCYSLGTHAHQTQQYHLSALSLSPSQGTSIPCTEQGSQ